MAVQDTVIRHIDVGLMECVRIQALNVGTHQKETRKTQLGAMICQGVNRTATEMLGWYLQVILMTHPNMEI